jgi:probable HAF family extracellular repeat protein
MTTQPHSGRSFLWIVVVVTVFATGVCTTPALAEPVFLGLGSLDDSPSAVSRAFAVSADGTTVVGGSASDLGYEAFRWTFDGGMVGLGDLPSGRFSSEARDVSADGSVIVGQGASADSNMEAFRWEGGVMSGLGDLLGGSAYSEAAAVSWDGTVVVGGSSVDSGGWEAFRWTSEDGIVGLGDFPGGELYSKAWDVSADGSVVVGTGSHGEPNYEAFRWTPVTGLVGLGDLPGGHDFSAASAVSSSGAVVIGSSEAEAGLMAYRWTQDEGMIALGMFSPEAMTADTSTMVGRGSYNGVNQVIIWNEVTGLRGLHGLLETDFGLNLDGWTLEYARGISADGTVIVGTGINPRGYDEGWVAVIPEPSTLVLLVFGVPACRRRWHRSVMV